MHEMKSWLPLFAHKLDLLEISLSTCNFWRSSTRLTFTFFHLRDRVTQQCNSFSLELHFQLIKRLLLTKIKI